ncbi:MAG TPA: hydroxymethylbilane synthase [Anaerolineaceae bacterium]|nr:MAG: hydroxymethylbilane synthase [Chloroflexi bacterium GWB2_54_36]HAL15955.1 hydroxymethylbilane synthase [Anaerolineaceae bacterium]HBA91833.1 hydroxymethylbilane synthase [Anaerolineaceae bacterium]
MNNPTTRIITLGSRPSKLARWQTEHILTQLKSAWPDLSFQLVTLVTTGDKIIDRPLPEIGGKGVFTAELESALRSGEIDLAVHSLKDLPVENSAGLSIGAVGSRACAQDVLISTRGEALKALPVGARLGTSSLRREAQVKATRPDLSILPLRGNVDTRLRKVLEGEYAAIILAAAGMERLDLAKHITEYLSFDVMLPAPGQGALAIQCRSDDDELLQLLRPIHDLPTYSAVTAERAFLAALGGGCSAPVAAHATLDGVQIEMRGLVAGLDGRRVIRVTATGEDPKMLGELLAQKALDQGAAELLG